jgi:quercetin dioxygenase-like cupin family protein
MLNPVTRHHLYFLVLAATLPAGCTELDTKQDDDVSTTSQAETRTILGRGTIASFDFKRETDIAPPPGHHHPKEWEMKAKATRAPSDVVMSQIDLAPGECVPWHYHSGAVFVILQAGTGTNYLPTADGGCNVETVTAGTALVDDGLDVHSMCNNGPDDKVTIFVTYVVPQGAATNIPLPNPGTCPGGAP